MSELPKPLSDRDYLALCVWDEARGEPYEGKLAVAEVVVNRAIRKCHSDGTIRGTVLAKDQFSGFYFDFVDGRYQRVCHDMQAADIRAHELIEKASQGANRSWRDSAIAADAATRSHARVLPEDAVLYLNPAIVHGLPAWATKDKFVATIGHHEFYRA